MDQSVATALKLTRAHLLCVAEGNVEAATEHFATEGFKIRTGARCLGICIGTIDN